MGKGRWNIVAIVAMAVFVLIGAARADVVQWQDADGRVKTHMRAVVDWGDTVVDGGFVLTITPAPGEPQVAVPLSRLKAAVFQQDDGTAGRVFGITLRSDLGARTSFADVRLLEYTNGVFRAEPFGDGERTSFDGREADSFQGTALSFSGGEGVDDRAGPVDDEPLPSDPAATKAQEAEILAMLKAAAQETAPEETPAASPYAPAPEAEAEPAPQIFGREVAEEAPPAPGESFRPALPPIALNRRTVAVVVWAGLQLLLSLFLAVDAFRNDEAFVGICNLLSCVPAQLYYVWLSYSGAGKAILRIAVTGQTLFAIAIPAL